MLLRDEPFAVQLTGASHVQMESRQVKSSCPDSRLANTKCHSMHPFHSRVVLALVLSLAKANATVVVFIIAVAMFIFVVGFFRCPLFTDAVN